MSIRYFAILLGSNAVPARLKMIFLSFSMVG